MVQLAGNFQVD